MSNFFNDGGVGHGAFLASFATAGAVILENFNRDRPEAHAILQSDQIGAPLKSAGVAGFVTATCTAQLPVSGGVCTPILQGDTVTVPNTHGGGSFYVSAASESYAVGDYWKANLTLRLRYN